MGGSNILFQRFDCTMPLKVMRLTVTIAGLPSMIAATKGTAQLAIGSTMENPDEYHSQSPRPRIDRLTSSISDDHDRTRADLFPALLGFRVDKRFELFSSFHQVRGQL